MASWYPWQVLGGARFAVVLLVLWALLASLGTIIPQGLPPEETRRLLGPWAHPVLSLGLDDIYTSPLFLGVLVFLCLNLAISSVRRILRIRREDRQLKIALPARDLAEISQAVSLPEDLPQACERVEAVLRSLGLRVRQARTGTDISYHAERGRWRLWGSTWAHLGLLLVFLGALIGHWHGWTYEGYLKFLEGTTREVTRGASGMPTGLSLKLHRFVVVGDETGRPLDFSSDIELLDSEGKTLQRQTIRVNDPLEHGATTFYQAGYGLAGFYIRRTSPQGDVQTWRVGTDSQGHVDPSSSLLLPRGPGSAFGVQDLIPQARLEGDQVHPISNLPLAPVVAVFENPRFNQGSLDFQPLGWLTPDRELQASDGSTLSFAGMSIYSGIQYRHDPGYPLVVLGFLVVTLGLGMAFYIAHRRIRVVLTPGESGTLCLVSGIPGPPGRDPGDLPAKVIQLLAPAHTPDPEAPHAPA
jgi:cytochrome c biogenesis protein